MLTIGSHSRGKPTTNRGKEKGKKDAWGEARETKNGINAVFARKSKKEKKESEREAPRSRNRKRGVVK